MAISSRAAALLLCRSDHYSYARYGIPVAFFSTGLHPDYHSLSDEVEYIEFAKLLRVSGLIRDVVTTLADRPGRPTVDGPVPAPGAECEQ